MAEQAFQDYKYHIQHGNPAEALLAAKKGLDAEPALPRFYQAFGEALEALEDVEMAYRVFCKGLLKSAELKGSQGRL